MEKRPDREARPHDRSVTRVGAQVASQRCPILRTGVQSLPQTGHGFEWKEEGMAMDGHGSCTGSRCAV